GNMIFAFLCLRLSASSLFYRCGQQKGLNGLTNSTRLVPISSMNLIRSICVYCGSSMGKGETYVETGYALGRSIAASGLRLVYGGGTKGIMGAVARGTMEGDGKVLGIIPRFLMNKEATES